MFFCRETGRKKHNNLSKKIGGIHACSLLQCDATRNFFVSGCSFPSGCRKTRVVKDRVINFSLKLIIVSAL